MSYPFEIRKVYNFEVYPATIIPGDYTKVTILGIIDPDSARQLADINSLHVNVYPYLPVGTPDDASAYDYVKVKLNNGVTTVLGIPWINQTTVQEVSSIKIYVLIDDVTTSDLDRVRQALTMNGYNAIKIGTDPSTFNS